MPADFNSYPQSLEDDFIQDYDQAPEILDIKSGLRPTVRDRKPIIGRHPAHPRLMCFNGLGTKGASLAPWLSGLLPGYLSESAILLGDRSILGGLIIYGRRSINATNQDMNRYIFQNPAMNLIRRLALSFLLFFVLNNAFGSYIFISMNPNQANHLKAYGIVYWTLAQGAECWWLLNYEGGSFVLPNSASIEKNVVLCGGTYSVISDGQFNGILQEINDPDVNMDAMKLEKGTTHSSLYTGCK